MYESKWASGIKWFNTIMHPTFFVVQGEVIYFFLVLIYVPSMAVLKFICFLILLLIIAKIMGYSLGGLFKRWVRLNIGKHRAIYSRHQNKKRFLAGI